MSRELARDAGKLFKNLRSHNSAREYRDQEAIFGQGDVADAGFYIQSGNVKLTSVSKRGKKAVIAILGQDDFFGENCLEEKSLRSSTATAMNHAMVARVTKGTLARCIHQKPAFAKLFISHLISRISRTEDSVLDQLFNDSERRLARVLVLLASFGEHSNPWGTTPKVTQGTLAQMVGTTRSRVSFFMNRFKERGLIHYNGGLQVHRLLLQFFRDGNVPPRETTTTPKG